MNAVTASTTDIDTLATALLEALEAELGAIAVYHAAVRCALQAELRSEWAECLLVAESRREDLLRTLFDSGVDPARSVPGRAVVARVSNGLVNSIESHIDQGRRQLAQNTALECARLMKRRDRIDWELLALTVDAANEDDFEGVEGTSPQLGTTVQFSPIASLVSRVAAAAA